MTTIARLVHGLIDRGEGLRTRSAALTAGLAIGVAAVATPCSLVCVSEGLKPVDALRRGYTVFVGEAMRLDDPMAPSYAAVRVLRSYSGVLPSDVRVAAGTGIDCKPYIKPGGRFLFVITSGSLETRLATDSCDYPITPLEKADRDLAPLEKLYRKEHRGALPLAKELGLEGRPDPMMKRVDLEVMQACVRAASVVPEKCVGILEVDESGRLTGAVDEARTRQLTEHLRWTWPRYCPHNAADVTVTPVHWYGRTATVNLPFRLKVCEAKRSRYGEWEVDLRIND